ncbi:hypothetical protein [Streptomyces sp. NPDC052225]|uniref:hypothetical protein n=1 Tax=Streptomyces sp. NPDC052225 TaxID=3154949 RepID=UPI003444D5A7
MFRIFRRARQAQHDPEYVARLARELSERLERENSWKRHADSFATQAATAERERASVYRERNHILAWIAALHPATAVIAPATDPDAEGWHWLYVNAGGWQMRWHISPQDLPLFQHVEYVEPSDPRAQWDGHGAEQKYQRMRQHVRLLALEDGAPTPVTEEARSA